jgi:hypothetical protein
VKECKINKKNNKKNHHTKIWKIKKKNIRNEITKLCVINLNINIFIFSNMLITAGGGAGTNCFKI